MRVGNANWIVGFARLVTALGPDTDRLRASGQFDQFPADTDRDPRPRGGPPELAPRWFRNVTLRRTRVAVKVGAGSPLPENESRAWAAKSRASLVRLSTRLTRSMAMRGAWPGLPQKRKATDRGYIAEDARDLFACRLARFVAGTA